MTTYLLHHVHRAEECGATFASFSGVDSPLRRRSVDASCRFGGHAIWWHVEARSEADALALLPEYVARRTTATAVAPVRIP